MKHGKRLFTLLGVCYFATLCSSISNAEEPNSVSSSSTENVILDTPSVENNSNLPSSKQSENSVPVGLDSCKNIYITSDTGKSILVSTNDEISTDNPLTPNKKETGTLDD